MSLKFLSLVLTALLNSEPDIQLPNILTWVCQRHLKVNMSKTELWVLLSPTVPHPFCPLSQQMVHLFTQLQKPMPRNHSQHFLFFPPDNQFIIYSSWSQLQNASIFCSFLSIYSAINLIPIFRHFFPSLYSSTWHLNAW